MARPERFERSTYGLEVRCSIQLSYGRNRNIIPINNKSSIVYPAELNLTINNQYGHIV